MNIIVAIILLLAHSHMTGTIHMFDDRPLGTEVGDFFCDAERSSRLVMLDFRTERSSEVLFRTEPAPEGRRCGRFNTSNLKKSIFIQTRMVSDSQSPVAWRQDSR